MHGAVESRVAALLARADESTVHAVEVLSEQVQRTAAETEAKMHCELLESSSNSWRKRLQRLRRAPLAMAEITTRTVVEGLRRDVQAQIDQNRADNLRKTDEAQRRLAQGYKGAERIDFSIKCF